MLCYDATPLGASHVRTLVTPKTFDPFFRDVAQEAERYIDEYKKPPGEHTLDIIQALQERKPDHKEIYDQLLVSLESTKDAINRDYVLAQAGRFARFQRLRGGIAKALEVLQQKHETNVDEAETVLAGALKETQQLFSPGLDARDPAQLLAFLHNEEEYLGTNIEALDKYNLGPVRGGLHLFMALPNRGKSWWGIHLGRMALMQRRSVLHVSLEMSEKQVAQRYVQAALSVSKRSEKLQRITFATDKKGMFVDVDELDIGTRPSLQDAGIEKYMTKRLTHVTRRQPRMFIKQFPTGQLTPKDLRIYLDQMESAHKFIPDLIVVDYADLMKTSAKHRREELGVLYADLRGIAVERNCFLATMTQSNRSGLHSKIISEGNVSEDWSKAAIADIIISYNQTEEEYLLGLARLFVIKARMDVARIRVLISQSYKVGQFCLESARMGDEKGYWRFLDKEKQTE